MAEKRVFNRPILIADALTVTGAVTFGSATVTNAVKGVAASYAVARGTQACTSGATITTGLSTIVSFAVSPVGLTATKANLARCVTGANAGTAGQLSVRRYKHSGASTATLVAATVAGTVSWVAVGTI